MENIEGFTYSGCDAQDFCVIRCIACQENQMFRSEVFVKLVATKSIPECKYCSDAEFVTNKSLYLSNRITLTELCHTKLSSRAVGKIAGMTIKQVNKFKSEINNSVEEPLIDIAHRLGISIYDANLALASGLEKLKKALRGNSTLDYI